MFTSYYFAKKLDIDLLNPKFVGISLSIPSQWQHITVYPPLFPTWDLLKKWRNKEITEDEYIEV